MIRDSVFFGPPCIFRCGKDKHKCVNCLFIDLILINVIIVFKVFIYANLCMYVYHHAAIWRNLLLMWIIVNAQVALSISANKILATYRSQIERLTAAREVPGLKPRCRQFLHFSRKPPANRSFGHRLMGE